MVQQGTDAKKRPVLEWGQSLFVVLIYNSRFKVLIQTIFKWGWP